MLKELPVDTAEMRRISAILAAEAPLLEDQRGVVLFRWPVPESRLPVVDRGGGPVWKDGRVVVTLSAQERAELVSRWYQLVLHWKMKLELMHVGSPQERMLAHTYEGLERALSTLAKQLEHEHFRVRREVESGHPHSG